MIWGIFRTPIVLFVVEGMVFKWGGDTVKGNIRKKLGVSDDVFSHGVLSSGDE
jgi:hypothetical protein